MIPDDPKTIPKLQRFGIVKDRTLALLNFEGLMIPLDYEIMDDGIIKRRKEEDA